MAEYTIVEAPMMIPRRRPGDGLPRAAAPILKGPQEMVEEKHGLWQEVDLGKRQKKMLDSGYMADFTIKVQNSTFRCHKNIIGASSPMFAKMIHNNPNNLQLQTMESTHFRFILEMIYGGETDGLINIDETLKVGKISNELQIYTAVACCAKMLRGLLNPTSVFKAIEFAYLTQNVDLKESCIKIIQEQTDEVLNCDELINCSVAALELIISQDVVHTVTELDLFKACARWANARESPREALGSTLRHIRFRLLTAKDFAREVKPSKLLTTQEENSFVDFFLTGEGNIPEGFSNERNRRYHDVKQKHSFFNRRGARMRTMTTSTRPQQPNPVNPQFGVPQSYGIFGENADFLSIDQFNGLI